MDKSELYSIAKDESIYICPKKNVEVLFLALCNMQEEEVRKIKQAIEEIKSELVLKREDGSLVYRKEVN
jgi:hypothetical protein